MAIRWYKTDCPVDNCVLKVYVNAHEFKKIYRAYEGVTVIPAPFEDSHGCILKPLPYIDADTEIEANADQLLDIYERVIKRRTIPAIILRDGRTPYDPITLFAMLKGLPFSKTRVLQASILEFAGETYKPLFPRA